MSGYVVVVLCVCLIKMCGSSCVRVVVFYVCSKSNATGQPPARCVPVTIGFLHDPLSDVEGTTKHPPPSLLPSLQFLTFSIPPFSLPLSLSSSVPHPFIFFFTLFPFRNFHYLRSLTPFSHIFYTVHQHTYCNDF